MENLSEELSAILKKFSREVEPKIIEVLNLGVERKFKRLTEYPILTGGKRIRPVLAIICCKLLGGKEEDVLYPAAGLEILHNYTLIVDDIIDHSTFRRGKETCWVKFGKSIAECIGIYYSAAIFQTAQRVKDFRRISAIFANVIKTIVNGEIFDILFEQAGREEEPFVIKNRYLEISDRDYVKMVSKKTASLFRACCEVGGVCADGSEQEIKALKDYGFNLGIAFQIKDDILDIFAEEKKFGKKIGKDIIERKLGNIVILTALKELDPVEREEFLKILRKKEIREEDVKAAMRLINKTKTQEKAYKMGEKYIKKAKESLEKLPQNKWNKFLEEIADFVIEREK